MVCPTVSQIRDEAQAMADKKTSVQNRSLLCKFYGTYRKLFKKRNNAFVSRLAQNVKSRCAYALLNSQYWTKFFNNLLKRGLEKVAHNSCPSGITMNQGFRANSPLFGNMFG